MEVTTRQRIENEKKLSKKDLRKSWRIWMMHNLSSMSFERFQAFGFCLSMLPVIKKLYKDKEEQRQAMKRHSVFYNTEPQLGSIVNGIAAGLEEKKANGEEIDDEVINGLKVGLMGPLAGIGDSMVPGMLIPILLSIGMGLAQGGSLLGPVFYILSYNFIIIIGSYYLFMKGYQLGTDAVELLVGEKANRVREAFTILGTIVMGGITASYVKLSTKLEFQQGKVDIQVQEMIDNILPNLLPLVVVILSWYLMTKKGVSSIMMMLILLGVATAGVLLGIF